jgi:putative oxidoreductase
LLVRVALASVFVVAGYQKLTGLSAVTGFFESVGIPAAGLLTPLVAVAEFFGGLGLLVGVLPRFSAGVLAVVMLVSTFTVAWPDGGWQRARLDVVLMLANLAILVAGAGRWTLPKMMGRPELDVESRVFGEG